MRFDLLLRQGRRFISRTPERTLFVFGGCLHHWPGMGSPLYEQEPVFRDSVRQTDRLVRQQGLPAILPHFEGAAPPDFLRDDSRNFTVTAAIQLAFTDLWKSEGLFPAAVLGQSLGEAAALYAAEAYTREDVVRVAKAMAMTKLPKEYLLVYVQAGMHHPLYFDSPVPLLPTYEAATDQSIAFCRREDLAAAGGHLERHGVPWQVFTEEPFRPFHSDMPVGQIPFFLSQLKDVSLQPLACDFFSCSLAAKVSRYELVPNDFHEKLLRAPVHMHRMTRAALDEGYRSVLTVGTHPFPEHAVRKVAEDLACPVQVWRSLTEEHPEHAHFRQTAAAIKKQNRRLFAKTVSPPAASTDRFQPFLAQLGSKTDMTHWEWLAALAFLRTRGNVHYISRLSSWMVLDYALADAILQDTDTFSNRGYHYFDSSLLGTDPPEHTGIRALMQPFFIPKSIRYLDEYVPQALADLFEAVSTQPTFDLARQVYMPLTFRMNALLLGLSEEDIGQIPGETPAADPAGIIDFFSNYLKRSSNPGDYEGLSAVLLELVAQGRITFDRAVGLMKLSWTAGSNTTYALLSHMAYTLLTRPALREQLSEHPEQIPKFAEECLRLAPPPFVPRVALRDTTLDGIAIPTGGIVIVSHLATNRDPNVFQHPDECLLDRPAKRHFAFGSGVHHCLGSHIGRMAANHFAQAFLPLAGKLALVPASPPHFVCTLDFNGAVSMPLRWKKQHQPTG